VAIYWENNILICKDWENNIPICKDWENNIPICKDWEKNYKDNLFQFAKIGRKFFPQ
jgi:hypothetical protein